MYYIEIRFDQGKEFRFVNCVLKHNHKDFVQFPHTSFIYSHVLIKVYNRKYKKRLLVHLLQNATRHLILTIYCRHIKFPKSFLFKKCEMERNDFTWISVPCLTKPLRTPVQIVYKFRRNPF